MSIIYINIVYTNIGWDSMIGWNSFSISIFLSLSLCISLNYWLSWEWMRRSRQHLRWHTEANKILGCRIGLCSAAALIHAECKTLRLAQLAWYFLASFFCCNRSKVGPEPKITRCTHIPIHYDWRSAYPTSKYPLRVVDTCGANQPNYSTKRSRTLNRWLMRDRSQLLEAIEFNSHRRAPRDQWNANNQ